MKYTKEFEKWWLKLVISKQSEPYFIINIELNKENCYLAWKAGRNKIKKDYDLVKPRDESPKFLPF